MSAMSAPRTLHLPVAVTSSWLACRIQPTSPSLQLLHHALLMIRIVHQSNLTAEMAVSSRWAEWQKMPIFFGVMNCLRWGTLTGEYIHTAIYPSSLTQCEIRKANPGCSRLIDSITSESLRLCQRGE